MRSRKYRAWDKVRQQYVPQGEFVFRDYGETSFEMIPNCQEYVYVNYKQEDFIIEEYIGRKDKIGQEIFEGDIDRDGGEVMWNQDTCQFVINYEGIEMQEIKDPEDWCEIIGNINYKN